ncbi:MAG: DUF4412 domain-containing protein [Bacteroidales bacterium]|nr:DUF4412 domain-containing protein [Bacteroidales bacterium]
MKRILTLGVALLVAVATLAQEAPKRFGIKSGEITTQTDLMGQKMAATTYFDNYGALQYSRTKMSVMGMDIDMGTLQRDGKTYMINYSEKTVQEMPAQQEINYMNLTDEVIAKNKVQEVGEEEVSGKPCKVYSMEISQMGQSARVKASVWEGIPMKTVTSAMGMDIVAEVIEVKECAVDASLFEVPKF